MKLACALVLALTLLLTGGACAQSTAPLVMSAPLTHSDWMLHEGVAWEASGVHHMLDMCKAAGLTRVHWRAFDAGQTTYRSKLADPGIHWDEDSFWSPKSNADRELVQKYFNMTTQTRTAVLEKMARIDYGAFDSLEEAVRYGHKIGLKIDAWITINEDDHGWGMVSRFAKQHPGMRWRKRDGTFYHSQLSFAFPEVREYKLALIKEILENYRVDGVFLDWLRTGDVRDNPQTDSTGTADHGYEEPLVKAFREKYGIDPHSITNNDPRWVQFRAEPHTQFMRAVTGWVRQKRPDALIAVLVAHPWCYRGHNDPIHGNLEGLLLDVPVWSQEKLMDAVVPGGYYMKDGTPEKAWRALREETSGTVDVWFYDWVPQDAAQFAASCAKAEGLGASHILWWEADYLQVRPNRDNLLRAMSKYSGH